ncbi:MAG: penicillin-binding transpeptidase domain-containing protein, partial [Bacteroidota bacterium]
ASRHRRRESARRPAAPVCTVHPFRGRPSRGSGGAREAFRLIREMVDPETGERYTPELPASVQIPVDDVYWPVVQEGMRRMAMENNASARWDDVVVAGKTGTAQNPHGEDHAWFVSYAPFDDPQIVVAVFVENGA